MNREKLFLLTLLIFFAEHAFAAEPICPGGSQRRSDITWCSDFENLGAVCSSGNELACATANGLTGISGAFAIKTGDAAVGSAAMTGGGPAGGTGPGYATAVLPTQSTSGSLRFYVKFKKGYMQGSWPRGNHGPAMEATNGSCFVRLTLDWFAEGPSFMTNGTCAPAGGSGLPNNLVSNIQLQNNRWYLVEMQSILNTAVSGDGTYNGNGVFRAWIDGVKVMEHTNLNIRGTSGATFRSLHTARSYYGLGMPGWSPQVAYDNFVFSSTGAYIGAAAGENARGTGDPASPYINWVSHNAMTGKRTNNDCSTTSGELGTTPTAGKWRGGTDILQTAVRKGGYTTSCPNTVDQAMLASTQRGNGAGLAFPYKTLANTDRLVVHGSVYLPSANDYNATTPLSGFVRYGSNPVSGNNNWGLQAALGVVGGKWSVIQAGPSGIAAIPTGLGATFNTWNEFELHITKANRVSLAINRQWILDEALLSQPVGTWAWDGVSAGPRHAVVGIIDYQGGGTFQTYYDDIDIGTASYWSCKGWNGDNCPFGAGVPAGGGGVPGPSEPRPGPQDQGPGVPAPPPEPGAPTGVRATVIL